MKTGAIFLHMFPPRSCLIERHIFVPLASWFRARWWLAFWAMIGIRNRFQQGLSAQETVNRNVQFLREGVNYPPTREVNLQFSRRFHIRNVESQFMKLSRRA